MDIELSCPALGGDGNLMLADGNSFEQPRNQATKPDNFVPSLLCCSTIPQSAIRIPHLNGSFSVFILGWTIEAIGV
jgi:hypothetical protein